MNPDGPYLSAAILCDAVLIEKDERVSCIRLLDVMNVQVHQPQPSKPFVLPVQLTAFVAFKSGLFVGTKECVIELVGPSGKAGKLAAESPKSYPMVFNGGEHGANLMLTFDLPISAGGLYWFNVMLDGEVYTRIPFKINITWPQSSPAHVEPERSRPTEDQA